MTNEQIEKKAKEHGLLYDEIKQIKNFRNRIKQGKEFNWHLDKRRASDKYGKRRFRRVGEPNYTLVSNYWVLFNSFGLE